MFIKTFLYRHNMSYRIDFSTGKFGVNTLNRMGVGMLISACGGEEAFIKQINDAVKNGIIDKRSADSCKAKARTVSNMEYGSKYKHLKYKE